MEDHDNTLPTRVERFWTVKRRAWLYGVLGALVPLLVTLGIVSEGVAAHISLIAAAVLAVGPSAMALGNLSDR